MSVMGAILNRVFDEEAVKTPIINASVTSATGSHHGASGPLAFPQNVDVEGILARIAARHREHLNWRSSIVDLLKLLHLDSSFEARRQLAAELRYPGDVDNNEATNIWFLT
jgi:hypothetical protein